MRARLGVHAAEPMLLLVERQHHLQSLMCVEERGRLDGGGRGQIPNPHHTYIYTHHHPPSQSRAPKPDDPSRTSSTRVSSRPRKTRLIFCPASFFLWTRSALHVFYMCVHV